MEVGRGETDSHVALGLLSKGATVPRFREIDFLGNGCREPETRFGIYGGDAEPSVLSLATLDVTRVRSEAGELWFPEQMDTRGYFRLRWFSSCYFSG